MYALGPDEQTGADVRMKYRVVKKLVLLTDGERRRPYLGVDRLKRRARALGAIDESRRALAQDPANIYLNNHLAKAKQQKLALLRQAAAIASTRGS